MLTATTTSSIHSYANNELNDSGINILQSKEFINNVNSIDLSTFIPGNFNKFSANQLRHTLEVNKNKIF
jgi:hypothetical protein